MDGPKGKYAWTATVGEKGQIVIPKQARDIFGIKPGDTLLLLGDEARGIAIPPKGAFAELFQSAFAGAGRRAGTRERYSAGACTKPGASPWERYITCACTRPKAGA